MEPIMTKKTFSKITEVMRFVVGIIVILLVMTNIGFYTVPSASMSPTIKVGTFVIYEPVTADELNYGDIVLFVQSYDENLTIPNFLVASIMIRRNSMTSLTKRVIGFSGDVIEVKDGYLWRNGEKQIEDYVPDGTLGEYGPYTVPEGYIFCMGDNRNVSVDSRVFGAFPENVFYGRTILILPDLFPND